MGVREVAERIRSLKLPAPGDGFQLNFFEFEYFMFTSGFITSERRNKYETESMAGGFIV